MGAKRSGGRRNWKMAIVRGDAGEIGVRVMAGGSVVGRDGVAKAVFRFGEVEKVFEDGGASTAWFDAESGLWVMRLTEGETMDLGRVVKWQVRMMDTAGEIRGTRAKYENVVDSVDETLMSNETSGSESFQAEGGSVGDGSGSVFSGMAVFEAELVHEFWKESLPRKTSDLVNDGEDGTSPFATEDYVDSHGGKIDHIAVDGVDQPIVNKRVNLSGLAKASALSQLAGRVESVESSVGGFGTRIGAVEQDVQTAQTNISTLSSGLQEAEQTIQEHTNDIEQLDDDVAGVESQVSDILDLIPSQATPQNQLADKQFVNSTVGTNTANFLGTLDVVDNLGLSYGASTSAITVALNAYSFQTKTNNDYCYVVNKDTNGNTIYQRFKFDENLVTFKYEFTLNNSSFTAVQWAAISSGITAALVSKISTNESNISALQTSKQNKIDANNKLSADYVNDANSTNKFVTATEKTQIDTNKTNIQNIQNQYLKNATVSNDTMTITKQDGSTVSMAKGSDVSVSSSGTATDEVKFITVNGVEKKLGGGSEVEYLTVAPEENYTGGGVKIVILEEEPDEKYNGYIYFIKASE